MKKIALLIIALLSVTCAMAQQELAFPFQGGKDVMARFFRDSLVASPQLMAKKATGTVVLKFTADEKGNIQKLIIYYADDLLLTQPVIGALKKSNHKWIIPDQEKTHDFIIPFTITFAQPVIDAPATQKALYDFYIHRKPVLTSNQVPLDTATLLPTIVVTY